MDVKFLFENIGESKFGPILRPVAKVTFFSPNSDINVDIWLIVDTGADYTILPKHFARRLQISIENDCTKDITFGVGGEQAVYFCKNKVKVVVGKLERDIPLAFIDNNEVPALLGRLGFLETFDSEFLKKHVVVFKD